MRYAGIIKNDLAAAPGISLTFFVQGCPHHCPNCHNPETWSFDEGKEFTSETMDEILNGLKDNNIERKFCVMGGEPLCEENLFLTLLVIKTVKEYDKNIPIFVWTGYLYEELLESISSKLKQILELTDVLVDGLYIEKEKDATLLMRGSKNQMIIDVKASLEKGEKVLWKK